MIATQVKRGALERTRTSTPLLGQPLKLLRMPFRHKGLLSVCKMLWTQCILSLWRLSSATCPRRRVLAPSPIAALLLSLWDQC